MSSICGACRRLFNDDEVVQEAGSLDTRTGGQLYICLECHNRSFYLGASIGGSLAVRRENPGGAL